MSAQFVCFPLYMEFENLFNNTFSSKVISHLDIYFAGFLSPISEYS